MSTTVEKYMVKPNWNSGSAWADTKEGSIPTEISAPVYLDFSNIPENYSGYTVLDGVVSKKHGWRRGRIKDMSGNEITMGALSVNVGFGLSSFKVGERIRLFGFMYNRREILVHTPMRYKDNSSQK